MFIICFSTRKDVEMTQVFCCILRIYGKPNYFIYHPTDGLSLTCMGDVSSHFVTSQRAGPSAGEGWSFRLQKADLSKDSILLLGQQGPPKWFQKD